MGVFNAVTLYLILSAGDLVREVVAQDALYPEGTENIVFLNTDNFNQHVYNSKYNWIINFYASWCGHCQHFAPFFTIFAKELNTGHWPRFTRVGVLACSERVNSPVCSQQEIAGYPTVKIYKANQSSHDNLGILMNKDSAPPALQYSGFTDIDRMKIETAELLMQNIEASSSSGGRGGAYDMFSDISRSRYQPLVNCQTTMTFTSSVRLLSILAILDDECVRYNRSSSDRVNEFHEQSGVSAATTAYRLINKESYKEVRDYLRSRNRGTMLPDTTTARQRRQKAVYTEPHPPTAVDIESAIRYSLYIEVYNQKLDSRHLRTLKLWLRTLKVLYVGPYHVQRYLNRVYSLLKRQRGRSTKGHWLQILKQATTRHAYLTEKNASNQWQSCQGTSAQYRGYPCSLWSLLHTLTVNRLQSPLVEKGFNARRLALIISRYIRDFFGCTECTDNFLKRAFSVVKQEIREDKLTDVILWLWRAHNGANEALKNTTTEDPLFAKIQYPSQSACPSCRDGSSSEWKLNQVLKHVIDFYTVDTTGMECVYSQWSECVVPDDNKCGLGYSQRNLIYSNATIVDRVKVLRYIRIDAAKSKLNKVLNKQSIRCLGRAKQQKRFCISQQCTERGRGLIGDDTPTFTYRAIAMSKSTENLICYPLHSQTAVKACNRGSVALGGWQLTPAVCRSQRRVSAPASTGAIYFNRGHRERGITTQRANQRRRSRVKLLKKINRCKATYSVSMDEACHKLLRTFSRIYVGIAVTESCAV